MITDDWEDYSGEAIQCLLLRPTKDHFPILLEGGGGLCQMASVIQV